MCWRFLQFFQKINEKLIWTHKSGWFFTLIFTVPIRISNSFKKSVLYQIFEKIRKLQKNSIFINFYIKNNEKIIKNSKKIIKNNKSTHTHTRPPAEPFAPGRPGVCVCVYFYYFLLFVFFFYYFFIIFYIKINKNTIKYIR